MKKKIRSTALAAVATCLLAAGFAGPAAAQAVVMALRDQFAMASQAAAKNRQALQVYTWIETTQISVNGDVKNTKVESCRYGPDGQVQRTELSQDAAAQPGGLRGMIAARKAGEMKTELQSAAALVHQYVPLDVARIQAVDAAGGVSLGQAGPGTAQIKFANYVQQGDVLTLTLDTAARILDQIDVATWLDTQSNTVTLDVNFDSLPDGTRYPITTTLLIPGSQAQVQIKNGNYQKLAQ
jgi:hypothetical protein